MRRERKGMVVVVGFVRAVEAKASPSGDHFEAVEAEAAAREGTLEEEEEMPLFNRESAYSAADRRIFQRRLTKKIDQLNFSIFFGFF